MSHHIIGMENVSYNYPDGNPALCDISLSITHGESVALVGENGSGKSTLLLHLSGCLFPSDGKVKIGDHFLNLKNVDIVRRPVGMVFQNPDDQLFMPTVFDDVAFGPLNLGFSEDEVKDAVVKALETVGMLHLSKRPPYKLSYGEKKSAAIASVLAMSPDILLMDEPTSSLDPMSRRRLMELLKTFHHTKIIATHDLDMAMELCGRAIVLHKGRITADGPIMEIFKNEELLKASNLEKPLSMQKCPVCG